MEDYEKEYIGLMSRVSKIAGDICNESVMVNYLKKYYLTEICYKNSFMSVKKSIFADGDFLSDRRGKFSEGYSCKISDAGLIFTEHEFFEINQDMIKNNENYLIIIEDDVDQCVPFRMRYPAGTSWSELKSGDCISFEIFDRPIRNYYIFVEGGRWAKYVNNDADAPYEIIGFRK